MSTKHSTSTSGRGYVSPPHTDYDRELTFEHLDGHLGHTVGLLFVQAQSFSHHHLAEAAFAQRFPQNQPETHSRANVRYVYMFLSLGLWKSQR